MTLIEGGAVAGIIACFIIVIGVIYGIARSGVNIFSKINKIDNIENGVNALLFINRDKIFKLYKDKVKIVINPIPSPFPDREELLSKLESGYLAPDEANRLAEMLKYEKAEAKRKDDQMAVLAIGALLLLVLLMTKNK